MDGNGDFRAGSLVNKHHKVVFHLEAQSPPVLQGVADGANHTLTPCYLLFKRLYLLFLRLHLLFLCLILCLQGNNRLRIQFGKALVPASSIDEDPTNGENQPEKRNHQRSERQDETEIRHGAPSLASQPVLPPPLPI